MRFVRWGALGLAVALAASLATVRQSAAAPEKSFKGQQAPEIQFGDWLNGSAKKSLSEFHGQVVLLEFWSKG